jgi:hypothetical protein
MRLRPDRQPSRYWPVDARRIRSQSRRRLAHRPGLEVMETRTVLSPTIYTVNSTGNGTSGSGTSGTLPYVISLADADTNPDGDVITFDPTVFSTPQTIQLSGTLNLDGSTGPVAIQGPGAGLLTINGPGNDYVLDNGETASLSGLTITGGGLLYGRFGAIGGGIGNGGILSLTDCTISGNTGVAGGGIDNGGQLTLTGCTISDNSAALEGGGVLNDEGPDVATTIIDSTISGNSAYGDGGGIYNSSAATFRLIACTISGNSSAGDAGAGIYNDKSSAAVTLTDTIVAGNAGSAGDIGGEGGGAVTGTYNLTGPDSGGIVAGSNGNIVLSSTDGLDLAQLADYGGPTQTMALLPGSPAIGAGTAVDGITTDQRGQPLDSPPDIGAYQSPPGGLLQVISVDAVGPNPRNTPVSSITFSLNEPIGTNAIPTSAVSLTDDQGPNLINDGVTVSLVSGSTYSIGGLSGLTGSEGIYNLTVNAADIDNAAGNPGSGSQSTSWLMDTTPPTSGLDELPSQIDATSFTINVTAFDAPGPGASESSGLASIAIYVSTDGGPYVLFTKVPPGDPSTTFTGQPGNTYSFYSIATDAAGNVQPTPQAPQATIRVNGPAAAVVGQEAVFRKLNKKGKPVVKAGLSGFRIGFNAPLIATTAIDPADYQVDVLVTRKARRKVEKILRPIANFQVSYNAGAETVTITLSKPQKFPAGGQVAILPGVTNAGGVPVIGPTVFAISKGGRSLVPD